MTTYLMDNSVLPDVRVKTDEVFAFILGTLFVLVYTQGYIQRIGVPDSMGKLIVETPVFLILLHLINRGRFEPAPGFLLVTLYVVWSAVSAIFNAEGTSATFLYCRYVVYAYLVFAAVWSTPMTRTTVTHLNTLLAVLFIAQIAASGYEVFVRHERVEAHVGALFAGGGSLATEFPLLAMGLTLPFYLCYRRNLLLLLLCWAFFLVGYASGKRAIYFLGPSLYFFILGWYVVRARTTDALKQSLWGTAVFVCMVPLLLLGMSRSHGLGQNEIDKPAERVVQAVKAAVSTSTAQDRAGQTTGRAATSQRVFSMLSSARWDTLLFGWGPSAMREEEQRNQNLAIGYGICGWAQDVICIGWPGALIYLLFHLRLFFRLRSCAPPRYSGYWRAIRLGAEIGFPVILLSYIAYSSSVITGGQLSYMYVYLLALLMSPQHRHIIQSEAEANI